MRRPLPWSAHDDPWAVLVSEFMLQQTQTARVIEPWRRFLERFTTPVSCADASLADVLRLWGALGYPKRAKALHDSARILRDEYDGHVPSDVGSLRSLPGVGEYTANAIASFAYDARVAVIDTNVGRVLARAVVNDRLKPAQARSLADELLPRSNVRAFNQAMLDLGAQFCTSSPRCDACPVARECRWRHEGGDDPAPHSAGVSRPQGRFEGSDRQVRGRILAMLRERPWRYRTLVKRFDDVALERMDRVLDGLINDGLVQRQGAMLDLA